MFAPFYCHKHLFSHLHFTKAEGWCLPCWASGLHPTCNSHSSITSCSVLCESLALLDALAICSCSPVPLTFQHSAIKYMATCYPASSKETSQADLLSLMPHLWTVPLRVASHGPRSRRKHNIVTLTWPGILCTVPIIKFPSIMEFPRLDTNKH